MNISTGTAAVGTDVVARQAPRLSDDEAAFEQRRRRHPRLWDSDWLVLRGMFAAIDTMAARLARPGLQVLDFGCGAKPYEPLFTSRGAVYQGADFGGGHTYDIAANGKLGAPDASSDLVVSFQVLEHVRDIDMYFAEARRVLRSDGHLLLSTHGTWLYHPHPEDHRRWTREGLIGDIEARGFEVIECVPVAGPLAWTTIVRLTCFRFAMIRIPVFGKPLAGAFGIFMNAWAWAEDKITPAWVTKDNACVYVTLSRPKSAPRP